MFRGSGRGGGLPGLACLSRAAGGAVIEDIGQALAQTLALVRGEPIPTLDGGSLRLDADSICLHGDGAHALAFARRLRRELGERGVRVRAAQLL